MKILVGCEYSGRVRDAFLKRGHDAISCDLLPTEVPGPHYQGDIFEFINNSAPFDLAVFHPPCTYLCNSGVRWLHTEPGRWGEMRKGALFFKNLLNCGIPKICVENPVMHKYAREAIGVGPDCSFQPWEHGHQEMKRTCLWLIGLPVLLPSDIVGPPPIDPAYRKKWAKVHCASPGPDRWKDRSRTLPGAAAAMAGQWG